MGGGLSRLVGGWSPKQVGVGKLKSYENVTRPLLALLALLDLDLVRQQRDYTWK